MLEIVFDRLSLNLFDVIAKDFTSVIFHMVMQLSTVWEELLITGVMSLILRKIFHLDLVLVPAEMICPTII